MARVKQTARKSEAGNIDGKKAKLVAFDKKSKKTIEKSAKNANKAKKSADVSRDAGDRCDTKKQVSSNTKARAYRRLAVLAGFGVTDEPNEAFGRDGVRSLVSLGDARRLMTYDPSECGLRDSLFDRIETEDRAVARRQSRASGPATAVCLHADVLLREVMLDATRAMMHAGRRSITVTDVFAAIRKYLPRMAFSVGPVTKAHLRHAQRRGIVKMSDEERTVVDAETKLLSSLAKKRKTKRA
jgi:histone H3/H4